MHSDPRSESAISKACKLAVDARAFDDVVVDGVGFLLFDERGDTITRNNNMCQVENAGCVDYFLI
jgi:hypothetical protein